jgi:uncharacterized protein (TIGR02145 family)
MKKKFLHIVFLLSISGLLSAQFVTKGQTKQEDVLIDASGFVSDQSFTNSQSITNVQSKQEGNTIAVTYDLQSDGVSIISLLVSEDGGKNYTGPLKSVSGDVGTGIKPGTTNKIVWDVTKERDILHGKNIVFRVEAISQNGTFTDFRDANTYKTVKIGNQTWMSENLNYSSSESLMTFMIKNQNDSKNSAIWCYDNYEGNSENYGRLYDWQTARNVCPNGWRLPSKNDFEILLTNFGGSGSNAFKVLLESGDSDFSAVLGGWRSNEDYFGQIENYGGWWSSSEADTRNSWHLSLYRDTQSALMGKSDKESGFSVRCIKE